MIRRCKAAGPRLIAAAVLFTVSACASPDRTIALDDPDEAEEFQHSLDQYASSVEHMLKETQQGENVSSFSLGMLSYNILTTVSSSDKYLRDYFNSGGQDVQSYLKTRFQDRPEEEIAALDRMGDQDTSPLRVSARYTLEALTHIPNSSDPPAVQARSREELAVALKRTEMSLNEAAGEVRPR